MAPGCVTEQRVGPQQALVGLLCTILSRAFNERPTIETRPSLLQTVPAEMADTASPIPQLMLYTPQPMPVIVDTAVLF